jgi:hypothetical protein
MHKILLFFFTLINIGKLDSYLENFISAFSFAEFIKVVYLVFLCSYDHSGYGTSTEM